LTHTISTQSRSDDYSHALIETGKHTIRNNSRENLIDLLIHRPNHNNLKEALTLQMIKENATLKDKWSHDVNFRRFVPSEQ
jgi:hypothetical protein